MKNYLKIFVTFFVVFFLCPLSKIKAQTIETFAGNYPHQGYHGDGGRANATSAWLNSPEGLAIDPVTQDLYIVDAGNNVVRKVDRNTNIITTVAGNNSLGAGYNGDNGQATAAELNGPKSVCIDINGNLFIADAGNKRVRKVDRDGIITTVAGNGTNDYHSPVSGPATQTGFFDPLAVTTDAAGNLYISNHGLNGIEYGIYRVDLTPGSSSYGTITQLISLTNVKGLVIDQTDNTLYYTTVQSTSNHVYMLAGNSSGGPTTSIPAPTIIINTDGSNGCSYSYSLGHEASTCRLNAHPELPLITPVTF